MIKLGSRARDTISGYEGIVMGRTEYMHGCVHLWIAPTGLDKDGDVRSSKWFDEPQCEQVGEAVERIVTQTGGPSPSDAAGHSRS